MKKIIIGLILLCVFVYAETVCDGHLWYSKKQYKVTGKAHKGILENKKRVIL